MVKKQLFIILILIAIITPAFAEIDSVDLVYKQRTDVDIKIPCFFNNEYCDNSVACNITIHYPNTSVWIYEEEMTFNIAYFNYTLNSQNTTTVGTYQSQVACGNDSDKGYVLSDFQITSSGMSGIGKETIVPAVILIALLVFCGFMAWSLPNTENALRLLFVGLSLFLLLIMIQYSNLATNEDAVGLTNLLDTTYSILLPVVIFVSFYFVLVKFLVPLLTGINNTYKERKQGKDNGIMGGR